MRNTSERRLKLLKMEGLGFSKPEIVKELSTKFQVSTRTVYSDFASRESWQPFTTRDAALTILNRYEQIYRDASLNSLTAENESNRLGWKKLMLDTNTKLAEHFIIPSILKQLKDLEQRAERGVFL